ncbi:hypothetical protein ACGF0D_39055 [Kitasatospora sp. NPDC048298]|uniref:hypothetical protein n=1 Tax=Kitasatospora sp. NPDC048298 TaxID=3364049 RepID=UPI00371743F7
MPIVATTLELPAEHGPLGPVWWRFGRSGRHSLIEALEIIPPSEGSLDRETWIRLIDILTAHSPAGPDTRCLAYYPMTLGAIDFDNLHVRAGRLGDAEILYDMPEADLADFSPANLWAEDRSWVLCTDYDLWATKVAGPPALIEALLNDTGLEAVRLTWAT